MPTLEDSGSNISIISKGSSAESGQHRYFTRSSARKYRSPFSLNCNEPKVHLTPLKNIGTGCGDVRLQVQPSTPNSKSRKLITPNSEKQTKIDMENTSPSRIIQVLKACIFIGTTGLIGVHMVDHYLHHNVTLEQIKNDLEDMKNDIHALDTKVEQVLGDGQSNILEEIRDLFSDQNSLIISSMPTVEHIKKLVTEALAVHAADKTGLIDFALESSGGSILNTRQTQNYAAGAPMLSLFGIPLCSGSNSPRTIIHPSTLPGECWAFKGQTGTAVIKLLGRVIVTGVSLEHIPVTLSPTGELKTAPKEFSIWGLENQKDEEGTFLGQFIYDINDGPPVQYFEIDNSKAFGIIEFKVLTNNGHPEYTCVYRIRVHGTLEGYKSQQINNNNNNNNNNQ